MLLPINWNNLLSRRGGGSILKYADDFDIMYYPSEDFITEVEGFISAFSDTNADNDLLQSTNYKQSTLGKNSVVFSNRQTSEIAIGDRSNFAVGTNDMYIVMGVRLSMFQSESKGYLCYAGGSTTSSGGWQFYCNDANTIDSYTWWFIVSDGAGSSLRYAYGSLDQDLFDDEHHVLEIYFDRDDGTKIYVDGVEQTLTGDTTSLALTYDIPSDSQFTLNSNSITGQMEMLVSCFAFRKSLPTETQRNKYLSALTSPTTSWRLNSHIGFPYVVDGHSISLIANESVTMYGDALVNVSIDNNLGVDYSLFTESGNNVIISANAGAYRLGISVLDNLNNVDGAYVDVDVIAKNNTGSKKVLMIGDSTIDEGIAYYMEALESVFDGVTFTTLGTRSRDGYNHQGESGKTYGWLVLDEDSPFTKSGSLDISAYFTDNSIDTPDIVYMRMGINDVMAWYRGVGTRADLYERISRIDTLIDGFLAYDGSLQIIIALPSICENSGDGWYNNYGTTRNQNEYIRHMHIYWQELMSRYAGGEYNVRVDMAYGAMFLDRDNGYPKTEGIHTNGVHPNSTGYAEQAKGDAGAFNLYI